MGLRVAIVGDVPSGRHGVLGEGPSTNRDLIEGMAATGEAALTVITFDSRAGGDTRRVEKGVTFYRLAVPPQCGLLSDHAHARRKVNAVLAQVRPQVVHAIGTGVHAYAAFRSGYPVVLTVHGVQREDAKYVGGLRSRLHGWLQGGRIERYCLRRARHVIVISPYLLQMLPELRCANLYHIPNPVADSYFQRFRDTQSDDVSLNRCAELAGSAALEPATDPTRILCIGALVPRKRVLDALEAVAQVRRAVPGVTIRFAGGAPDGPYEQEIHQKVAELGLQGCATFLGAVAAGALAEEFRHAAVVLLTSSQETAPMAIAEGMAAGKAVVATRVGGVPNLVQEGVTAILTRVGAVEETAAALERLLSRPDECAAMGARGREFARQHFSVAGAAADTLRVYRKVAEEGLAL